LVLFFTRRLSLKRWDELGMFQREVALYRRLEACGIQVSFVTYGGVADLDYAVRMPGIRVCPNRWQLPRRVYERLIQWLHGDVLRRCSVIKTNQTDGSDVALRAARWWNKPLVARCGYMWSEFEARTRGHGSRRARRARRVEKRVFSAARRVVVTTPAMADDVRHRFPATACRVHITPNYVDTDAFDCTPLREPDVDLLFVGRLDPQKNVDALLQAVRPLNVRLMLIGGGEEAAEWRSRHGDWDGRLIWQGNVRHPELPDYMNRAKAFILPSAFEGNPKALIEAAACGLPVIAGDSPGIREMIRHRETGYLCGTRVPEIREAVRTVLADAALRRRLGRSARELAVAEFSLNKVVEKELTLLGNLLPDRMNGVNRMATSRAT
jgi:glycosyltransferase involved in cell wall biosynthesis